MNLEIHEAPPSVRDLERELATLIRRYDNLQGLAQERVKAHAVCREQWRQATAFLELAPMARERLEHLSKALFGEVLDEIEANLSHGLREILGQERTLRSIREISRNRLNVNFFIESPEGMEDIMRGQGGSACNILSVGLRLIALSRLDPARHRPFLVLDEQDCWLKPELVPVFMKLVSRIAKELEVQVLVISHHPVDLFAMHADAIHTLRPRKMGGPELVRVKGTEATSE